MSMRLCCAGSGPGAVPQTVEGKVRVAQLCGSGLVLGLRMCFAWHASSAPCRSKQLEWSKQIEGAGCRELADWLASCTAAVSPNHFLCSSKKCIDFLSFGNCQNYCQNKPSALRGGRQPKPSAGSPAPPTTRHRDLGALQRASVSAREAKQ